MHHDLLDKAFPFVSAFVRGEAHLKLSKYASEQIRLPGLFPVRETVPEMAGAQLRKVE